MANELILIIDDSSQIIKFITDYILEPHNYRYLVAQDGAAGLKLAIEHQPDLILLDLNMPKMTGTEVLEAFNTRAINTPVIVMTFHGSEPLAVKTFRMGVKDYLLKPFTDEELLQAIGRALTEQRLRQERDELTKRLLKSNQALEQRLRELNTLFGIGKSITSVLGQNKLMARLVEAAVYLTNAEEGSLLLLDKETDELYMAAAQGIDRRVADSFRAAVAHSLSGSVLHSGHPLVLTSKETTKLQTGNLVRSLIFVPLKIRGQVSGVLGVTNRHQQRDFTNHDLRLLSTLADYAVISLENTELFDQVANERLKLATVLSEIAEPVVVIRSEDEQIVVANEAFRQLFGLADQPLIGQSLAEQPTCRPLTDFVNDKLESSASRNSELSLDKGRVFYATLTPIPEVGRAIVMQEVTHLRHLTRLKTDFVSTMARELQAPLNSMKAYAHMLTVGGELDDKQQLLVDRLTDGVDQVTSLIDRLLYPNAAELGLDPSVNPLPKN